MEITEVVERVRAGDKRAFAAVVTRYQEPLFGYLGRMGMSQALAEEIAQETFIRVWMHVAEFDRRRGSFDTWFYTIARRLALNALSRHAVQRETAMVSCHEAVSEEPQPSESLVTAERRQLVRAALWQLPPAERSVVALVYTQGLSLADVARVEGCTVGAVKSRLHRARSRLSALLENDLE